MKFNKIILSFIFTILILLSTSVFSFSKVVGNKIILGSTLSLTGENSPESELIKNNQEKIIQKINEKKNLKINGKIYLIDIIYYNDESKEIRANQLIKRLIQNEGVEFLIGSHNFKLSDEVKSLIDENQLVIVSSRDALSIFINAFQTVNSLDSKKIRKYIIDNK